MIDRVRKFVPRIAAGCCFWMCLLCGSWGLGADDPLTSLWMTGAEEIRHQILKTAELPGGAAARPLAEGPVLLWVERCFVGTDNAYSGEGTRYVVVRLSVVNRGSEELQLQREKITLSAGKKTFSIGTEEGVFRDLPLEIDWHVDGNVRPQSQLRTPRQIKIEKDQAATFWCVFVGVDPVPAIPQLTLKVELQSGQELKLNLNEQQNSRLGLTSQRIGPSEAVSVLTIHGQLNRVNSKFLAEKMGSIAEAGSSRFLVEWASEAAPSDEVLFGWLLSANPGVSHENQLFLQLPVLPALREVLLAQLPAQNEDALEWEESQKWVFETSRDAAIFALRDIDSRLSSRELMQQVRAGHPWSQEAILRTAGGRLGPEALPLLIELTKQSDGPLRSAAIFALGSQTSPLAEQRLQQMTESRERSVAESALESLLAHASPERRASIRSLLSENGIAVPREAVLALLARYYHPDWNDELTRAVKAEESRVRAEALKVLHQVGHPQLTEMCIHALQDPSEDVRKQAFLVLIEGTDRVSEQAAREFALQRLRNDEIDEELLDFIEQVQATQAAPDLLKQIEKPDQPWRGRLIQVIGEVGNDEDLQAVLKHFDSYSEEEQISALQLVNRLSVETQLNTARMASRSASNSVRYDALELLKTIGNDGALSIVMAMIQDKKHPEDLDICCITLGEIGTDAAVRSLYAFRTECVANGQDAGLKAVEQALKVWRSRLPGFHFIQTGYAHIAGENDAEAAKAFTLAIRINPDLADAYSARGNLYLRQSEFEKAGADFERALELDDYDGQAVTGVAIVRAVQGKWESALDLVRKKADQFPHDRFFEYNTACVYSRCVEARQKDPPSTERDQQIRELGEQALAHLKSSITLGFEDYAWMQKDPDLAAIRELPAFTALQPKR